MKFHTIFVCSINYYYFRGRPGIFCTPPVQESCSTLLPPTRCSIQINKYLCNVLTLSTLNKWWYSNKKFWTKVKDKILALHTFKTSWPDGRGVIVLKLCQYNKTSSVRSCILIERAAISSWKSVSVYWHLERKGLKMVRVVNGSLTHININFSHTIFHINSLKFPEGISEMTSHRTFCMILQLLCNFIAKRI